MPHAGTTMTIFDVATFTVVALGLGGLLGKVLPQIMAACQDIVESAIAMVTRIFFVTKRVQDVRAQTVIFNYLNHKTRGYGNLEDEYGIQYDHIRPLGRKQSFFARFTWHTWRLWFFKRAPIIMSPHSGNSDQPAFIFLRGTVNWDKLILDACDWDYEKSLKREEENKQTRFKIIHFRGDGEGLESYVGKLKAENEEPMNAPSATPEGSGYEPVGWRVEDIGVEMAENPTDTLAMNENMQEVVREVDFWYTHEQWHKDREIPWKLGVLLYGPPGTGKTSLVRAIAMKLDIPVYSFDLSTMSSREFVKFWERTRSERTRIILLEDIDAVFEGRKNVIEGHRLSFDVLLNTIDGIDADDGALLFVTTNKVESVDEALGKPNKDGDSTRPGRIDLTFEIGMLDAEGRFKIAYRILKDDELANMMALDHPNDTPVIFRQRCRKLAVNMLWGRE